MSTLHIYRGLPASGKTQLARNNIALNEGGRLAGRDHFRPLVGVSFDKLGTPAQESEVTRLQNLVIVEGLRAGEDVHVDDQNLRTEYVRRLQGIAKREGAKVEIHDLTHVPVEECLRRDAARGGPDLREVIVRNYKKFIQGKETPLPVPEREVMPNWLPPEPYVPNPAIKPTVIVDLDGTLADHEGIRGHHEYARVGEDQVVEPVRNLVWWLQGHAQVIFISGRPDSCRAKTLFWLAKTLYIYTPVLYMRKAGDRRADFVVKREIFEEKLRRDSNIQFAIDDRNQVVDMWRQLGITTFQVAEGNF